MLMKHYVNELITLLVCTLVERGESLANTIILRGGSIYS